MSNIYDVIIFDGDNTAHKAYHRNKELSVTDFNGTEIHTGMCYGFLNMMLGVYRKFGYNGTRIMVAWDVKNSSSGNKEILSSYKSNRVARTEEEKEAKAQFDVYKETVKQVLSTLNILQFYKSKTEADDIIATLSTKIVDRTGYKILIVTEDKDYRQLISKDIHLYGISQQCLWNMHTFREKTGLNKPSHFVDYLAIVGDAIDGFSGVTGFGSVKAMEILTCELFANLDSISERIMQDPDILYNTSLTPNTVEKFINQIDELRNSYQLAKLNKNINSVSLYSQRYFKNLDNFKESMKFYKMNSMLKTNALNDFENIRNATSYLRIVTL